jgi:hypothetical protein
MMENEMKAGDKIRVMDSFNNPRDFTIELFRYCLGFFFSEQHREASEFTPLCKLYYAGPESKKEYISNFGEYTSNEVPSWMDLPKD